MREEWLLSATKCFSTDLSRFNKIKVVFVRTMSEWYLWYKFDIKEKIKNFTGVIEDMPVILQMDDLGCLE
jgi:hypothetical protein